MIREGLWHMTVGIIGMVGFVGFTPIPINIMGGIGAGAMLAFALADFRRGLWPLTTELERVRAERASVRQRRDDLRADDRALAAADQKLTRREQKLINQRAEPPYRVRVADDPVPPMAAATESMESEHEGAESETSDQKTKAARGS